MKRILTTLFALAIVLAGSMSALAAEMDTGTGQDTSYYITNVDSGRGLIKCGSAIVPFMNSFPKNRLYQLMTTRPSETMAA